MNTIENTRAVVKSAKHAAAVSLHAARDLYTLLEAERKDTDEDLLRQAAINYRALHGCSATEAFVQIAKRAEYLRELAAGESTFYAAKKQLEAGNENYEPVANLA